MVNITRIIQKISAMLVVACLFGMSAQAHESRPARAILFVDQPNQLKLEITLDVERFLTSTQVRTADSHDIEFETVYRKLQSLAPEALSHRIARRFASGLLPLALLSESDRRIELTLEFADIPAKPSAGEQRISTLHFSTRILPRESAVRMHVPVPGTAVIASVGTDEKAAIDGASQPFFLLPGETSPLMMIEKTLL